MNNKYFMQAIEFTWKKKKQFAAATLLWRVQLH